MNKPTPDPWLYDFVVWVQDEYDDDVWRPTAFDDLDEAIAFVQEKGRRLITRTANWTVAF